jgi:hypothetical protein
MSTSPRTHHRSAVLCALAPLAVAGLVATAGPAAAIPFEGDPEQQQCLRVQRLPDAGIAGSPLFVSFGYVLVLATGAECSAAVS